MQVRRINLRLSHCRLHDRPCWRALGGGDIDLTIGLPTSSRERFDGKARNGRGEHEDARRLGHELDGGHAFAEERTLGSSIRGITVGVEGPVDSPAHDDVAGHAHSPRRHPYVSDLRPVLDGVQAGVHNPPGHLDGIGDDQLRQVGAPVEGSVADGCQPFGQDDAPQGGVVSQSPGCDLDRVSGNNQLADRIRRKRKGQLSTTAKLRVQDPAVDGIDGAVGADGDGRKVVIPSQRIVPDGGQRRAEMELGQSPVSSERRFTDAPH